jgi:dTDP-4-dehydrorhamnose reductase
MVTGSAGMLGTDAVQMLRDSGHKVVAHTRASLDLTDPAAVAVAVVGIDVVLHCAAWTAVDDAETQEEAAGKANAVIPGVVAAAASASGARMVQISTDYVFAGDATEPYPEDARTDPRSAYGRTKAAGEEAVRAGLPEDHLIVRTAWLYGAHGGCFPKTIARAAAERGALSGVSDQVGQPTWTVDVVDLVQRLVAADAPSGTYHATSSGTTSWFGFARAVVASAGMDPELVSPCDTAAFPRPAPRPAYSVLGHDALLRIGVEPIADWADRWGVASAVVL